MEPFKIKQLYTDRSSDSLRIYMKEINKYPLLTEEEEEELVELVNKGDEKAKEKLINSNLRFVISVAKSYQNQGLPLVDLINEGNIGLIKAVNKFDSTKGFKFISYAVWWIRQSILQSLADNSRLVRLPLSQTGVINKLNKIVEAFEKENERKPNINELIELSGATEKEVIDYLSDSLFLGSTSLNSNNDDGVTLEDMIPSKEKSFKPDIHLMKDSLHDDMQRLLKNLSELELQVIIRLFGIDCTPLSIEDLSVELNITIERVRQIKNQAINKMRQSQDVEILKKYLG